MGDVQGSTQKLSVMSVEVLRVEACALLLRDVCLGLHTPERAGLTQFKEGMAFPVVNVPSRSVIPALIGAYIKARRPAVHYRLTGRKPDANWEAGP